MTKRYRIAEVAIRVNDLDGMANFYQEELGFAFHKRQEDAVFLEVGPLETPLGNAGHPQLFALFARGFELRNENSVFDHIAFEIPPEDYEAELERFQAKGMVIRERTWPDSLLWRGRSFFFRDPEGNVVELIAGAGK